MPGVALPIPFDGVGEMFQRAIIAAFILGDAAIAGMDIAERHRIVGFSNDGFGFLQKPGGLRQLLLLKAQPTLQTCITAAMRRYPSSSASSRPFTVWVRALWYSPSFRWQRPFQKCAKASSCLSATSSPSEMMKSK